MVDNTLTAQLRKKELRRRVLRKRRSEMADKTNISRAIAERITQSEIWTDAETIMAYLALPEEVSADDLIQVAMDAGKTVCVPVLSEMPGVMHAVRLLSLQDVIPGKLGIREPANSSETISPERIDMVVVPGAAFDRSGARLGVGGGYYDRFLALTAAIRIGICADEYIMEEIPMEEHDQHVDYVVTEKRCYRSGNTERRKRVARQ